MLIFSTEVHVAITEIKWFAIAGINQIALKHLEAVQEAINKQGSLTHTAVHGVIAGLA